MTTQGKNIIRENPCLSVAIFLASCPRTLDSSFHPPVHRLAPSNLSDVLRTIALSRRLHANRIFLPVTRIFRRKETILVW
jgi:hypothetical protein